MEPPLMYRPAAWPRSGSVFDRESRAHGYRASRVACRGSSSPTSRTRRCWTLSAAPNARPEGDLIECGVALGGSAIVLASYARDGRQFHGYDVFGMIPPPGPEDPPEVHERYRVIAAGESEGIGGDAYYGYRDDLYDDVVRAFERQGLRVDRETIQLHRGLFEDTLRPQRDIAVAHLDCDWYEPMKLCLERIWPHLTPGGFVICDDYYDWDGAAKAVDEFRLAHPDLEAAGFGSDHLVLRRA